MSETFEQVRRLIERGEVRISDHGYDQLAADGLFVRDILASVGRRRQRRGVSRLPEGPLLVIAAEGSRGESIRGFGVFQKAGHHPQSS